MVNIYLKHYNHASEIVITFKSPFKVHYKYKHRAPKFYHFFSERTINFFSEDYYICSSKFFSPFDS